MHTQGMFFLFCFFFVFFLHNTQSMYQVNYNIKVITNVDITNADSCSGKDKKRKIIYQSAS